MSHLEEMRQHFGEAEAAAYQKLIAATSALVTVATDYFLAEDGSEREARASESIDDMIVTLLKARGDKPAEIMRSLLAVVVHLRLGGSIREWFEGAEVEIPLLKDES